MCISGGPQVGDEQWQGGDRGKVAGGETAIRTNYKVAMAGTEVMWRSSFDRGRGCGCLCSLVLLCTTWQRHSMDGLRNVYCMTR